MQPVSALPYLKETAPSSCFKLDDSSRHNRILTYVISVLTIQVNADNTIAS